MRIQQIESTPIAIPLQGKREQWAFGECEPHLTAVIVELRTDDGLSGWGECCCLHPTADITREIVDSSWSFLKGESPFDVERILKKILIQGTWHWHQHTANWALAGIEMALWDLIGKSLRTPVYRLMGGAFRRSVPFIAFLFRDTPDAMAREAEEFLRQGFETFYLKVGIDETNDLEVVRVIRETIGPKKRLRVDANEAWSPATAVRMMRRLEAFDLEFVEQPLLASDLDGLVDLRKRTNVPIGLDQSAWTLAEVFEVVKKGAADVLVIDPGKAGGLWACKKVAGIAEAVGIPLCTHAGNTFGIGLAAIVQLSVSTPNMLYANQTYYPRLQDDILKKPFKFEKGCLPLLESPGLGVEPDREKIAHFADYYRGVGRAFVSHPRDSGSTPIIPGY